jgi:hypothetical protein
MSKWRLRCRRQRNLRKGGWAGVGGGSPRHRGSACIPSEPPSLAHPKARAMAAEKVGPSLWWAGAIALALRTLGGMGHLFRVAEKIVQAPSIGHRPEQLPREGESADRGSVTSPEDSSHIGVDANGYLEPRYQGIAHPCEMRSRSAMRQEPSPAEDRRNALRSAEAGRRRERTKYGRSKSKPCSKAVQLSLDLTPKGSVNEERAVGIRSLGSDKHIEGHGILATVRSPSAGGTIEKEPRSGQPSEDPFRMSFASIHDH